MQFKFDKMQGTGNDFVMINGFKLKGITEYLNQQRVKNLCDRKFGIGADGLIVLKPSKKADFEMVYFNADGNESTMCGNGGRCAISAAFEYKLADREMSFIAIDGLHDGIVRGNIIELSMKDVNGIIEEKGTYILDTGSPHYVDFFERVNTLDVKSLGAKIRYSPSFEFDGINVNFVELLDKDQILVRTYERGVEDETLSCGTGVTASVLAAALKYKLNGNSIKVKTLGGNLEVKFHKNVDGFEQIKLIGPAEFVFSGEIDI